MKISTRGRYGLRLLLDLARHAGEGPVALTHTAKRQQISTRYLEQVAIMLKRGGFLRSVKGTSGGYQLNRPAADIIIGDVLRYLEDDLFLIEPLSPGEKENKLQRCLRECLYTPLNNRIADLMDSQTLESLLCNTGETSPPAYMYFI